jgi:hypothetical protein
MEGFKVRDRVRFKPDLMSGACRKDHIGTVIAINDPPAQGGPIVDIRFDNGEIERGIRIHQIERA